jgi:pyrroloquinoline quinone biosynthesis protein D
MADESSVPIPRRGFRVEAMGGETLIYRHSMRKAIYLNESAAVIWQLCDGRRTIKEIVDALAEAYPGERDELAMDVNEAVERLHREGALRFGSQGPE